MQVLLTVDACFTTDVSTTKHFSSFLCCANIKSILLTPCTPTESLTINNNMKSSKSCGPNSISTNLLIEFSEKRFESSKIKYLGMIKYKKLNQKGHIAELTKNLSRAVGLIYKIRYLCLSPKILVLQPISLSPVLWSSTLGVLQVNLILINFRGELSRPLYLQIMRVPLALSVFTLI